MSFRKMFTVNPIKNNTIPFQHIQGEILFMLSHGGGKYVVLKRNMDAIDDAYLFRYEQEQLVDIDDEQEWEQIAEMVDQYLFDQYS